MTLPAIQFEERHAPSRPFRIAAGRRRSHKIGGTNDANQSRATVPGQLRPGDAYGTSVPPMPSGMAPHMPAGADQKLSRESWGQSPRSLDTEKYLATSDSKSPEGTPVLQWLKEQETEKDRWVQHLVLHKRLLATIRTILEQWRAKGTDDVSRAWMARYSDAQRPLEGEEPADSYQRLKQWMKENKPVGSVAEFIKWEKTYWAISNCGKEWIGYRAACCGAPSIAVPVGCNHRLCPLCAWHRSQRARVRIKTMFDKLACPVLITLTVPNPPSISKDTFKQFRQAVKVWMQQWDSLIVGGIYSIETTYNRAEKTWHVHAHVLADFSRPLPARLIEVGGKSKRNLVDLYGKQVYAFTALKWRMEFDWLNLTGGTWGRRPKNNPPQKSHKAKAKWNAAWGHYWENFSAWVAAKREHSTAWAKYKYGGKFYLRKDLKPDERAAYALQEAWNAQNTRVFDVRPVDDREGAAKEVLKYITKVADFCDYPEAIEMFCNAVKGARMVQTFGSWYGFNLETQFDPQHLDDWGKRECACGLNDWEKLGVFHSHDVEMDEAGRWHLKRSVLKHNCRGTVVRPRIRGADSPPREGMHICETTEMEVR